MRTKLPEIYDYSSNEYEVRDRDSERKGNGKLYGDQRRQARDSEIKNGDGVLVKKKQKNKLSTVFNPKPVSKKGKGERVVFLNLVKGPDIQEMCLMLRNLISLNLVYPS
ncbi:hypothetical protein DPMN_157949 [Dreissena polymorpha]|uniref:Uncharacterized protein n=1 Tax=Dreissena polymorpha TaxID=45954 RepID=A0A9D4IPB6_DREPO|nr:hypothetical protein DPMN_157949 [Dreissena polymorpha]